MLKDVVEDAPGVWITGIWYPKIRTQTIVPDTIVELWFVYDPDGDGYCEYHTEKEAHDAFLKAIEYYRDAAAGDEWSDEVERVTWGKVFQTTSLEPIEVIPPDDDDYDALEGMDFAEAFAIEHRKQEKT